MTSKRYKNQLLIIALAVGFFVGILYENILLRMQGIHIEEIRWSNVNQITETYLWQIVKLRSLPILGLWFMGKLRWKKQIVLLGIGWTGLLLGVLTVLAVAGAGVKGLILCLMGLLPHMIFYALCYGMIVVYLFYYPSKQWNAAKFCFVLVTLLIGILTEAYLSPILLRWTLRFLM